MAAVQAQGGIQLESHTHGELTIQLGRSTPGLLHLDWLGKSNDLHPWATIHPYLERVLGVAHREGLRIELHFDRLEHFNSTTVAVLIQLIRNAWDQGVKLALFYDSGVGWQSLAFGALRIFERSDGLVEIFPREP